MNRRLVLIFLSLLFFQHSFSQSNLSSPAVKDNFSLYLLAVQSELLGDYENALKLYSLSSFTENSEVYYPSIIKNISLRLMSGDYSSETESLINKASNCSIDKQKTDYFYIDFLVGRQQFDKASDLCNQILASNPFNDKVDKMLAILDYSKGSLDSALIKINNHEFTYGADLQLYQIKREILARKDLYDSLLSYNDRIYSLYPENLEILADLANVYTAMGKDSVAHSYWNSILEEQPESLQFLYQANQFYSSRGYKLETVNTAYSLLCSPYIRSEAKEHIFSSIFVALDLRKDTLLIPTLDSLLLSAAMSEVDSTQVQELSLGYFSFREKLDSCSIILDSLISRHPTTIKYYLQKANVLNTRHLPEEAFTLLDSAAILFPHVYDIPLYHAELLNQNLSEKDAIKFIRKAIKSETVDSSKAQYLTYLADLTYKRGKATTSFSLYEKALALSPKSPMILNNYAYFLACSGIELEKALTMSHTCNSISKDNSTYIDTEAYILFRLGLYDEAKQMMEKAISLGGDDVSSELYLHYADILKELGNRILAKNYYKKALDAGADPELIAARIKSLN